MTSDRWLGDAKLRVVGGLRDREKQKGERKKRRWRGAARVMLSDRCRYVVFMTNGGK